MHQRLPRVFGRRGSLLRPGVLLGVVALAGCGDSGTGASGGSGGQGGQGGAGAGVPLVEVDGCEGTTLFEAPADTGEPGPWKVGARTLTLGDLVVEAWYPAAPGSSGEVVKYDVRDYLPESEMGKIADADAPLQTCACERDLPVDADRGPYPVIVFVHGTAGFRSQSLEITAHWASRGFVVLAADHPGLYLTDLLAMFCGGTPGERDLDADLAMIVDAVNTGVGLGDLADVVDASRIGMSGHSAGGGAIEAQGDVASVLVPMAAGGFEMGSTLQSGLVLGGVEDTVVDYENQVMGYEAAPSPKRLAGISPAGHLVFSSLCHIENDAGEDLVSVAQEAGVCGLSLAGALFDCSESYVSKDLGHRIVNDVSTAVFEETLHCNADRTAWITGLPGRFPEVSELREEL